jgi:hypothetical protein
MPAMLAGPFLARQSPTHYLGRPLVGKLEKPYKSSRRAYETVYWGYSHPGRLNANCCGSAVCGVPGIVEAHVHGGRIGRLQSGDRPHIVRAFRIVVRGRRRLPAEATRRYLMSAVTEAIEHWPLEFQGVPPVKTLVRGDGSQRLRFVRRIDGAIQFFSQRLTRCETDGYEYYVWHHDTPSGLYLDLSTAMKDAERLIPWLRDSD